MMNTKKETLQDRLRLCAKRIGGGHELARQTKISRQTLENYFTGKSEPKISNIIKISEVSGVSLEWLAQGNEPMIKDTNLKVTNTESMIAIPYFNAIVAAGGGAFNERAKKIGEMPFSKTFLLEDLNITNAKNLIVLRVAGESMEPTIADGNYLLVDEADKTIQDGIFAFLNDGNAFVKRLSMSLTGIEIISDNPIYPSSHIKEDDLNDINIIGRVRWIGRKT